jgi:membrane-associated phospholipid phosphatase
MTVTLGRALSIIPVTIVLTLAVPPVCAQDAETPTPPSPDQPKEVAPAVEKPANPVQRAARAVAHEAGRYFSDSLQWFTAPVHWRSTDWEKAGGFALVLGGLFIADEKIDHESQNYRSRFTNHVSSATTSLGGGRGPQIAGTLLVAGLVFKSTTTRDMGREALEAGLFTSLAANYLVKPIFGRERPFRSNGETDFDIGSSNSSFPSGHATEAFSVASVVAARAKGWVIPTIAYTAATIVAFDRVNDRVHFASDVFAGAVFGTVTGRYLVHKHDREATGETAKTSLDIIPIRNGLAARLTF